ncbi:MAG TPA: DUF1697 domain-containing protein [Anaerolineales bacterium]|nr:DUF1697 domain-containing protein [Anaerolineales bacterium]
MKTYVILMRGINVGGKNKISMTELKTFLEEQGFAHVRTFIQSGNVILQSKLGAKTVRQKIEKGLPGKFKLDSSMIKVLALTSEQLQKIVDDKPKGFGDEPGKYHSDVVFLMGISADEAMKVFKPREGVDNVWQGDLAIYSQRLSAQRTQSRLSKIIGTPAYQSMTIRNWNTTTKLLKILEEIDTHKEA